jgi:SAM-dependent methyltransferase
MNETSKSIQRRLTDSRFLSQFFVGYGIDIGSGPDSLAQYSELFPLCQGIRSWDKNDGDAQVMLTVKDKSYDFVHSSHCLEHMKDPIEALHNWERILKPGGHLVMLVPDEDLYERGVWPSQSNPDHKYTFTIYKKKSWSPVSLNVIDLVVQMNCAPVKIELLTGTYRKSLGFTDQTKTPIGECAIEIVLRKL